MPLPYNDCGPAVAASCRWPPAAQHSRARRITARPRETRAGATKPGNELDDSDSVAATVRRALHATLPDIPVTAARGPSVKSDKTGDDFTVWDDSKTIALPAGLGTRTAVTVLETIFTIYYKPDVLAKAAVERMKDPTIAQKAEAAAEATGHFYEEFQAAIKNPSASLTLNRLIAGAWTLMDSEYQKISDNLGLGRKISVAELQTAMQRLQAHGTLALARPMSTGTT